MIEAALRQVLVANTGVTSVVAISVKTNDPSVRVERLHEHDKYPAIEIQIDTEEHIEDLDGWDGTSQTESRIVCIAETAQQAASVLRAVQLALEPLAIATDFGVIASVTLLQSDRGFESYGNGKDEGLYLCQLTCSVWFHQTL